MRPEKQRNCKTEKREKEREAGAMRKNTQQKSRRA